MGEGWRARFRSLLSHVDGAAPSYPKRHLLIFLLPGWVVCIFKEWWASSGNSTLPGKPGDLPFHLCRGVLPSTGRIHYYYSWLHFFFYKFIYLFIYFWLCRVFVSVRGLSLVAASVVHSSSRCAGLSLSRPLLLRSTGYRRAGSVIVAHGPSCSAACGIFPDQGSNPCPLHWQADSQLLRHQGRPWLHF